MTRTPTGRLQHTDAGGDLVLTRTFRASAEDVWASVTESERTARWFGPWRGEPGVGRTIKVQQLFEEGTPWSEMHIDACEPPRRLAVTTADDAGTWRMELLIDEHDGSTELRLIQHLDRLDMLGETGPGWEYYLDALVASREGGEHPDFDDYYPAMKSYFENLA